MKPYDLDKPPVMQRIVLPYDCPADFEPQSVIQVGVNERGQTFVSYHSEYPADVLAAAKALVGLASQLLDGRLRPEQPKRSRIIPAQPGDLPPNGRAH